MALHSVTTAERQALTPGALSYYSDQSEDEIIDMAYYMNELIDAGITPIVKTYA